MFEKPNSLAELSESELTSIVMSLNGGFDGGAPDPGYSWEEHFQDDSDCQGEGVPPWFKEWIKNFTSDDLLTMDSHDGSVTISLLKDQATQQFRAYGFYHSQECPPIFFGDSAYPQSKLNAETVWLLVQGHFDSDPSYGTYLLDECDLTIHERDLIPQEKIVEFLKKAYSDLHQKEMNPDDPECLGGDDRVSLKEWIRKNYGDNY
jgi:hypothetical protein